MLFILGIFDPNWLLTSEFDPTSVYSGLSQGIYLINKQYHFKKITQNNSWKWIMYKNIQDLP